MVILLLTAGGKITQTGKEGGVVYGEYIPPDKVYTTHPKVEKVEFLDENNKVLNQNTKDFYYGQKLKIKVTTSNAKGEMIVVDLQGKSKSKSQKFDILNTRRFSWNGLVTQEEIFETPYFVLNPNWHSDDFEKYNYETHQTEIREEDLNEFLTKIILDAKSVYLPLEGERLKPITYKRNYEELIGLFKTNDSGDKDILENYENLYIDKYADENDDIKDIVDDFSGWLCKDNTEASIDEIGTKVSESAKKLWDYAVLQHQAHSMKFTTTDKKTGEKKERIENRNAVLDDRPLYWARIAMQVILKRQYVFIKDILTLPKDQQDLFFKKSIIPKKSKLWDVMQLFEEKSRNYTDIGFSKAPKGSKKVLITGFDPFQLNPDSNFNTSMGSDSANTFNPSGIVALFLNQNQELLNQNIFVQTCIFPVRYEDFDDNCVEKVMQKYFNEIDIIMTTSLNGGYNWFDIEADAIEYRGSFHDNMCIGGQDYSQYNYNTSRFISNASAQHNATSLPKTKIFGSNDSININKLIIKFDDSKLKSLKEGGGGNYLSNEIMFRATKIRGNSTKPVGHFHLANLGTITRIKEVIDVTKEIINKIIK